MAGLGWRGNSARRATRWGISRSAAVLPDVGDDANGSHLMCARRALSIRSVTINPSIDQSNAIEPPSCSDMPRFTSFLPETSGRRGSHNGRATPFSPTDDHLADLGGARHIERPADRRERPMLQRVGCQLVDDQGERGGRTPLRHPSSAPRRGRGFGSLPCRHRAQGGWRAGRQEALCCASWPRTGRTRSWARPRAVSRCVRSRAISSVVFAERKVTTMEPGGELQQVLDPVGSSRPQATRWLPRPACVASRRERSLTSPGRPCLHHRLDHERISTGSRRRP